MTSYRRFWLYLSLCLFLAIPFVPASIRAADLDDAAKRATEASGALAEIMQADNTIPDALMRKAQGIAVIPDMKKGALGFGGTYGKGLVTRRLPDGRWSPPVFIHIGGGSFGLQLGVQETDLVLVFTDAKGVDALLDGKLELGADAAVAAGPVGRRGSAGTDIKFESAIYSYSRTAGAFAGVSLEGSAVTIDDSANEDVYGDDAKFKDILAGRVPMHSAVRPFTDAVTRYTSPSRTSAETTPELSSDMSAEPADAEGTEVVFQDTAAQDDAKDTAAQDDAEDTAAQDDAKEPAEGEQLPATAGNLLGLLIAGGFSFAAAAFSRRR